MPRRGWRRGGGGGAVGGSFFNRTPFASIQNEITGKQYVIFQSIYTYIYILKFQLFNNLTYIYI